MDLCFLFMWDSFFFSLTRCQHGTLVHLRRLLQRNQSYIIYKTACYVCVFMCSPWVIYFSDSHWGHWKGQIQSVTSFLLYAWMPVLYIHSHKINFPGSRVGQMRKAIVPLWYETQLSFWWFRPPGEQMQIDFKRFRLVVAQTKKSSIWSCNL